MNETLHTFIATGSVVLAYYLGKWFTQKNYIGTILDKLEKDGFIKTIENKDGEKDMIPIAKIITDAYKDAYKNKKIKEK